MSNGSKVSGVDGRLTPIAFGGAGMVLVLAAPAEHGDIVKSVDGGWHAVAAV
jgi:hypothetical protein